MAILVLGCAGASSVILALITFACGNFGDRNDFLYELWPPYQQLYHGHVGAFINTAPSYIGAAIWRAPLALLAMALGAGWRVTFLVTAVPCFAVPPLFGVWFASRVGRTERDRWVIAVTFALLTVLDPLVWYAGLLGHPEELVGIILVVASVVVAAEGRLWLAVILMLAGILNKPGLGEALPVMAAALPGRYARPALTVVLGVLVAYALYNLTALSRWVHIHALISNPGGLFSQFQLLWWFGSGSWFVQHEHVLIAPFCTALVAGWWLFIGRTLEPGQQRTRELLWLLAFTFLLRTAIEPWDITYYNLPLVFPLLCLEAGQVPWMAAAASVGALVLVPTNRVLSVSPDVQAAVFSVAVVPTIAAMAIRVFGAGSSDPPASHESATRLLTSRST